MLDLPIRPRRLRRSASIRSLSSECTLLAKHLIYPLFVWEEKGTQEIDSMPGCLRHDLDSVLREIEESLRLGISSFALFPVISPLLKNSQATQAYNPDGLIPRSVRQIKQRFADEVCLVADVALDPFTDHGHDGLLSDEGQILNDDTVIVLANMALCLATAGVDVIAPSDMMDGRIAYIRKELDRANFINTLILSYAAKYASSLYNPFRDALSSMSVGSKKSYQMDYNNALEAEKEVMLDIAEGADMLMIKPGLCYLDIVQRVRGLTKLPLIAYSVSGEYSMTKAAALKGWLDEEKVVRESLTAFVRAGANAVITYYAKSCAEWLRNGSMDLTDLNPKR